MTPVMCPPANSNFRKLAVETNKTQVRWSFMVPFYKILLHKGVLSSWKFHVQILFLDWLPSINSKFLHISTNSWNFWHKPVQIEFTRRKTSFVATGITQYTLNPHICLLMQHFIYESDGDYTYQGSSSTRLIMTQKRSIRPLLLNVSILH